MLHGEQPVAVVLPARGEGKAHRTRVISTQLGGAHDLGQTARGNLRPPLRERADAADKREHGLHALGRKEVLRLTVRERHILRNEIRDERPQDGMLGRDHRDCLVGIVAGSEVAAIDALSDVTRQGGILLCLALKDGLRELGLVPPRAVCPDRLVVACGEAALDLHRHPLAKLDNIRSGAVVGHEHNALRVVAIDKLVDALDGRALEAHDGLVVIAHRHDVGALKTLTEELDDPHLGTVGVLELVNLDVGIGVLELLA